jgi:urease accessory protein UreE
MLVIERIPTLPPEMLKGKHRDALVLTAEQRRWPRQRLKTVADREVALALPTGTTLAPGAILAIGADWYLEIEAANEPVLAIRPPDRDTAVRIAFEVGNHHFPLAIDGPDLLVPDDTAMEHLLNRLGAVWSRRLAVFNPVARGHAHER